MSRTILCPGLFCVQDYFVSRTILCRGLFCVQDGFVSRTILCRGLFRVPVAILAPKSLFTQFHFFLLSSDLMERSYGSNPTVPSKTHCRSNMFKELLYFC